MTILAIANAVANAHNRRWASVQGLKGKRTAGDGMLGRGWDAGDEGAGMGPLEGGVGRGCRVRLVGWGRGLGAVG